MRPKSGISNPLDNADVTEERPESVATCMTFLREYHPDLAEILEGWDYLPEAIKAGIVAMVRALGEEEN